MQYPFLEINDDAAITTKTYQTIDSQNMWKVNALYWQDGSHIHDSGVNDFTITITSISDTEVKGTFSGIVDDAGVIKTITEGKFTAKMF
ncbi:MAG: hypothetical protein H7Y42_06650 [Chitinophagaceae bacterium]|nr:hypothetical protein [Chitinophagaceae bacterium]